MSNFKYVSAPDVFEQMWRDFDSFFNSVWNPTSNDSRVALYRDINYPPLNVWAEEDSKDLILEFALAGIPQDNVEINVEGDYLELTINKDDPEERRDGYKLIRKGIKSGAAKQRIYIPASKYDTENIQAQMQNGILLVKVPSREESRPRKVKIQTSGKNLLE